MYIVESVPVRPIRLHLCVLKARDFAANANNLIRSLGLLFDRLECPAEILEQNVDDVLERRQDRSRLPTACMSDHFESPRVRIHTTQSSVWEALALALGFECQQSGAAPNMHVDQSMVTQHLLYSMQMVLVGQRPAST